MVDVIATVAENVKADVATAKTDIRSVVTSRFNDVVLATIILGSIWIGHLLK